MMKQSAGRTKNPIVGFLMPILVLLLMAGLCFAFCYVIWALNNASIGTTLPPL